MSGPSLNATDCPHLGVDLPESFCVGAGRIVVDVCVDGFRVDGRQCLQAINGD